MNTKIALGAVLGAIALRKATDHLHQHHPHVASKLALPAHYLHLGSEVLHGLDMTRPHTALATLARVLDGRPPSSPEGGKASEPMPRGLIAALEAEGWTMSAGIPDNDAWDVLWQRGWQVVHTHRGMDAYEVRRYFGSFWLLTVKGGWPITGHILESKDNPLRSGTTYIEATWRAIVVRQHDAREQQHELDPSHLSREEIHDLMWHEAKLRRCFSVHTYTREGSAYAVWAVEDEAHTAYTYIGTESAYKARWTRMLRERRPYNVMIFGPPGCGKTTLMRSWFEEEGVRVAEIAAADLVTAKDRLYQVFYHAPDVLLIEDFDRISPEDSAQLLWLFEHSAQDQMSADPFAHQPMIFATSNHPRRVADAFWRPGRFDQVIEVKVPASEQWPRLIHEIAARFGVDSLALTEAQRYRCNTILSDLSVAHFEQYMQRLALDPGYEDLASDRTFDPPVRWEG